MLHISFLVFLDRHFDRNDPTEKMAFIDAIAAYVNNTATKSLYVSSFDIVSDMKMNGDLTTTAGSIPPMFVLESIMIETKLIDPTDMPKKGTVKSRSDAFSFLYTHYDLLMVIIYIYYGLVERKLINSNLNSTFVSNYYHMLASSHQFL